MQIRKSITNYELESQLRIMKINYEL